MKVFAVVAACLLLALTASAAATHMQNKMLGSSYGGGSSGGYGGGSSGGSSGGYGGESIPAPPCPKNYLFSCQPHLSPVPCSPPASSYGSAGAYTQQQPIYALPQQAIDYNNYQPY